MENKDQLRSYIKMLLNDEGSLQALVDELQVDVLKEMPECSTDDLTRLQIRYKMYTELKDKIYELSIKLGGNE